MPASSIASLNSWGLYIFASVALVLLFIPQLGGVAKDARESADWRNVDGVRAVIDSLRPGITTLFAYGPSDAPDDVRIGGHLVSCSDGNGTISMLATWVLPNVTLFPSVQYRLSLVLGIVTVKQNV
jgi:hypothetical protein